MTIKDQVKALYKKAQEMGWDSVYNIVSNEYNQACYPGSIYDCSQIRARDPEDCPSNPALGFVNSSVLRYTRSLTEIPVAQRSYIESLGFSLKPYCFWVLIPTTNTWMGFNWCHIQYAGRELTLAEMWLSELKQRAIDLGFDVRDSTSPDIGWGFYGATKDESYNNYYSFMQQSGVIGSANRYAHNSGYIWAYTSIYAYKMYPITEPLLPELCQWISSQGGPTMLTVPDIFELIDSYLFNTPPVGYSFVPTILQLFGVVDYYLRFDGDATTGCDYY